MRTNEISEKSWLATLLLCYFFGILGVHRFYTGHVISGLIQLFTLGGFGIWWLIDLIMIVAGGFRDCFGHVLVMDRSMVNQQIDATVRAERDRDADRSRFDTIDSRLARIEAALGDLRSDQESLSEDYRFIQRVLEGVEERDVVGRR